MAPKIPRPQLALGPRARKRIRVPLLRQIRAARTPSEKRRLAHLAALTIRRISEGLVRDGRIDTRGKTTEELIGIFSTERGRIGRSRRSKLFALEIDHRSDLLRDARRQARDRHIEQAVLFYATYLEHVLNDLVATTARRQGLANWLIAQMLRDAPANGKATWLLRLLGQASVAASILARAQRVFDRRNAFVNYKWPRHDMDSRTVRTEAADAALVRDAEQAVRYFQRRERAQVPRRGLPPVGTFTELILRLAHGHAGP